VLTPVMMPLSAPVKIPVVPIPGCTALIAAVTPKPIWNPARPRLVVLIPMIWSAASSM